MKAIMVMYDSLRRDLLESYGCDWTKTPNFKRLADLSVQFEKCYVWSSRLWEFCLLIVILRFLLP